MIKKTLVFLFAFCLICALATGCTDQTAPKSAGQVDLDLTELSVTLVAAEVNNMKIHPDDYMGKTVKIDGLYIALDDDGDGIFSHYLIVDQCCLRLEFVWNGDHTYPDDYPNPNTELQMTGVYKKYEEAGQARYCLSVDDFTVL